MFCAVINCWVNLNTDSAENVSFHRFPSDEKIRKLWLLRCGRETDTDTSRLCVCSIHFSDDYYVTDAAGRVVRTYLKNGALPDRNLFQIKQEPPDENDIEIDRFETWKRRVKSALGSSEFQNGAVITNGNVYSNDIQIVEDSIRHQSHVKEEVYPSSSVHIPSALPPSTDWPGNYGFDVSFGPQEKNTKGVSWTYSKTKNKLYVGKDVSCPINFSANEVMTDGFIRATVLYSSPEHTSEVVQRCATHIKEDTDQGLYDVEHFVRCESNMAHYEVDQLTKQRSVVVPFENPPAGQPFSTYLFKFSCFGSCAGGPNRRSLMIIFKLEQGCQEIGRRKLELKVCACPGRDRKTEEKQVKEPSIHVRSSKRAIDPESISVASAFEPKRRRAIPNEKGYFTITTRDIDCYNFLKEMKKMHGINSAFKKLPPETKRALLNQDSQPRSSDPEE